MRRRSLLLATPAIVVCPAYAQLRPLSVSYSVAAYRPLMEETAVAFEAAGGPRIELRHPATSHEDHLQLTLRDAVTGEMADVAFHGSHLVPILARRGIAMPLDRLIAEEREWAAQGYAPAVAEAGRFGDATVGLPWQVSVPVIFYNTTLVRRAEADPEALPSNWAGIVALAASITAAAGPSAGGFFDYLTNGNWTFQALVTAAGGRMMSQNERTILFGGPEGLVALRILRAFSEAGMVDMTQAQSQQAFAAGNLGVLASFSSLLGGFERAAAANGFGLRVGPWPLTHAAGRLPAGGRSIVIQSRGSARQTLAWRYVKWMTGPEVQSALVQRLGAEPANSLAVTREDLLGAYYRARPNARVGLEAVPLLTAWFAFPGDNATRIVDLLRDRLRDVATRRRTPDEALPDMVRLVQGLLPAA